MGVFKSFTQEPIQQKERIEDGEIVTCILLEKSFNRSYLKKLIELNEKTKEKAEAMGVEHVSLRPNHKEGGISWRYAVVKRRKPGEVESTLTYQEDDDGYLVEPDYITLGTIEQNAPRYILDNTLFNQTEGLDLECLPTLEIQTFMPRPFEAAVFKDGKPLYKASEIPDELRGKYSYVLEAEERRLELWGNILKEYESLSEEEAEAKLNEMLCSHYALFKKKMSEDGIVAYVMPELQVGGIFKAQVWRSKKDGKYLDIRGYSIDKEKKITMYSDSYLYHEANVELAETIKNIRKQREVPEEKSSF